MTTALLDINVLLALVDGSHADHERAHVWAEEGLEGTWATCAITQNGFVRIISQPSYPSHVPAGQALDLLEGLTDHEHHQFWPCDLPLSRAGFVREQLLGPKRLTDAYLLSLAVARDACFVTFDQRIDPAMVHGASARHLHIPAGHPDRRR